MAKKIIHGREHEQSQIQRFLELSAPGLTFVRGRRRIGKSALLTHLAAKVPNAFYFMGAVDESPRQAQSRFARDWDKFAGTTLSKIRVRELTWDMIFQAVEGHAKQSQTAPLLLMIDEIQWIAKGGSGFCGRIKEHWLAWKTSGFIKVLIAGSSTRFFQEHVDGAESILYGLSTFAHIWIKPFTPAEVRQFFFPYWSKEQVSLIYMMFGGVPFYLEDMANSGDENFMRVVNQYVFTKDSKFIAEVDKILRMEAYSTRSMETMKTLLRALGQDGATEGAVVTKTGFKQPMVNRILAHLVEYGLIKARPQVGRKLDTRYYMDDFFLNFYFQVLEPMKDKIEGNQRGFIFPLEVVESDSGFYIADFSGKAFELLAINLLAMGKGSPELRGASIFKKLRLAHDASYTVGSFWESKGQQRTQIDIVVECSADREARLVECKWIGSPANSMSGYDNEIEQKKYPAPNKDWTVKHFLLLSRGATLGFADSCRSKGIEILTNEDLY